MLRYAARAKLKQGEQRKPTTELSPFFLGVTADGSATAVRLLVRCSVPASKAEALFHPAFDDRPLHVPMMV